MIGPRLISLLVGVFALAGAHGAATQETGGVRINGSVHNVTTVNNADNAARGSDAKAYMSIGSIGAGVVVDGNIKMSVDANRVTNYADGPGETAITSIGSVHKGTRTPGEVDVHVGDVTNVSDRPGEASCVIIGSKGHIPECDQ